MVSECVREHLAAERLRRRGKSRVISSNERGGPSGTSYSIISSVTFCVSCLIHTSNALSDDLISLPCVGIVSLRDGDSDCVRYNIYLS